MPITIEFILGFLPVPPKLSKILLYNLQKIATVTMNNFAGYTLPLKSEL